MLVGRVCAFVGLLVCWFVCMSDRYRLQLRTDLLHISLLDQALDITEAYCFGSISGQGQGQGHAKHRKHNFGHNSGTIQARDIWLDPY